jgi:hypothetical protein
MQKENAYEFRKKLTTHHYPIARDNEKVFSAEYLSLERGCVFTGTDSVVISNAKQDFRDFLSLSFGEQNQENGVEIQLIVDGDALDDAKGYKGRKIVVGTDKIVIYGNDERGIASGIFDLELLIKREKAPFVKVGEYKSKPLFSPRMTHSAYDMDTYPDEYLLNLAKEGVDAIIIFVRGINKNMLNEDCDINDIIARANAYGLDAYAYCVLKNFTHPDDPDAEEIYDDIYGKFYQAHSAFKGIIFVGESVEFPSKDPHVGSLGYGCFYGNGEDNIPEGKPSPGFWPCNDYPKWLSLIQKCIHKHKADAELIFWTYNWGYAPEEDRVALINALPEGVTLLTTYETFQKIKIGKAVGEVLDYTISVPTAGRYFISEAQASKKKNIKLYTMSNTSGKTWDFGVVPFQAVPFQWNKRWKALSSANEKWGLTGIMENHHFGWWPSFIAELEKEAYIEGGIPFDEHVKMIASRDYGEENVDEVIEIWKSWSEAAEDYVPTDCNQYGTFRIGPAYPFTFGKKTATKAEFPAKRYASNSIGICRLDYLKEGYVPQLTPERIDNEYFEKEIELLIPAAKKYEDGREKFLKMAKTLKGRQAKAAEEMANLAGYFSACYNTAINVKRGAIAFRNGNEKELLNAARAEYKNAKEALKYVEYDSRLGWEASMEYTGGVEQIKWKLKRMEQDWGKTLIWCEAPYQH